jgi:FkbM family methyltransferase
VATLPTWRDLRGAYGRRRRALRQAMLEPLLVGRPVLRDTVMQALAARGHLVFCDLGDAKFFADPSDRVVGAWLIWHGGWQRRELDRAVAVLTANGRLVADTIFVDVGANIGTHTVYALRSGQFARAVAFEPEPKNARLLAMNLEANGLAHVATIVAKAAGNAPGTAVLHLHPRNKAAHAIAAPPSVDGRDRLDVPVVRVEDALRELGLSADRLGLIWIDVEGYEPEVIQGLGELLARKIPIAFEYAAQRYRPEARRELVRILTAHYSTLCNLTSSDDQSAPISALAEIQSIDDILVF